MGNSIRVRTPLKTIENPSIDAYRKHFKDPSIDYHVEVKRESEQARRSLREKARKEALKRQYHHIHYSADNYSKRRGIVDHRGHNLKNKWFRYFEPK